MDEEAQHQHARKRARRAFDEPIPSRRTSSVTVEQSRKRARDVPSSSSEPCDRKRPQFAGKVAKRVDVECRLLALPTALIEQVLSFLPPIQLSKARVTCSAIFQATPAAMHVQAQRAGLQSDWQERHRSLMAADTPALHLLHVLCHCGPVARLVEQLRCRAGLTAKLACARIKDISPDLISAGAELLVGLLEYPSIHARAGALNALSRASRDVILRCAPAIELRLQDENEFVRLAALNVLAKLPADLLARSRAALEACRDDVRNDADQNGGFVFRAVRATLRRVNPPAGAAAAIE